MVTLRGREEDYQVFVWGKSPQHGRSQIHFRECKRHGIALSDHDSLIVHDVWEAPMAREPVAFLYTLPLPFSQ